MIAALGMDTSNYTTSAAVWQPGQNRLTTAGRLLPVRDGAIGLQQSEAVFLHTRQLPGLVEQVLDEAGVSASCVGVSSRPRDAEGSYMPCFLVGVACARAAAAVAGAPLYETSHQAGHIAAALYSAGHLELADRPFLAFHLSGGTTEGVLVHPDGKRIFAIEPRCRSLDLHAGQVVDRVGRLLGLSFPAGRQLDELSQRSGCRQFLRPAMKGADCCLSGVVNRCERLLSEGWDRPDVARYCILSIQAALAAMTEAALRECAQQGMGELALVYAGGVMANSLIRLEFQGRFGALFARPELSSDNAAGVAVLACMMSERGISPCRG